MLTPAPSQGSAELARLIQAVRTSTPSVLLAAARAEQTQPEGDQVGRDQLEACPLGQERIGQETAPKLAVSSEHDRALLAQWLTNVAHIAALSCDQPDVTSKELGAKLLEQASHLNRLAR